MGAINHGSRHPAGRHRNATRGHNQQNLLPEDGAVSQRPSSVTSLNWNNSRSPNNSVLETTVRMNGNAVSTNLAPNNTSNGQKLSVNAKMENKKDLNSFYFPSITREKPLNWLGGKERINTKTFINLDKNKKDQVKLRIQKTNLHVPVYLLGSRFF